MELSDDLARLSTDPTLPKWISEVADRLIKEAQKTARLNAELHTANIKIQALTLELAHHRRMRFGAKSEAFSAEQRDLFQETWESDLAELEAEVDAQVEVDAPRKKRARAGRQPLPDHLERVVHLHEPDSCTCGQCGGDLVKIGEDITEQLDVEPARFFVHRHIRPQYARELPRLQAVAMWSNESLRVKGVPMRQKFKTLHIKTLFAGSLGVVLAMSGAAAADTKASSAYLAVDPMIGTGGDGHTYPGATTPFGMIQLSPDTEQTNFKKSYKWAAGYQYGDSSILGFSHTHFSGSGHSDLGDVLLMPISGEVKLDPGTPNVPRSGYRSQFSHTSEHAEAGYYSVTLSDYDTRVELTASSRIGWHRYTFPAGKPAHVLLDMRPSIYDYDGKVLWSQVRVHEDGTITGYRETRGWAPGRQLYFAMRFSAPMVKHELIDRETEKPYKGFKGPGTSPADTSEVQSKALEAVFDFGTLKSPLLVKVAISAVSEANALGNLEHDAVGWDFDGQRAQARKAWEAALSAVDVDAPAAMRRSFYTALYHAMLAPNLAMDANGDYRGPDHQVHHAKDFSFYSTWSTWDTFRAEHPLITIVQPPQRTNDFVHSLIAAQQASPYGILPVWAYQGLETWCMIGYHSVPIIADAYMKGIRGYPVEDALKAMIASATYAPYGGLDAYMKLGYVPIDKEPEAASKTLEYAFDDWTLAQMARASGHKDVAEKFEKRAANWRNVLDPVTGFVRAKKTDGSFNTPFDPAAVGYGSDYTEGNAWQYTWFAPQDIAGLTRELGGTNKFLAKLDAVFDTKVDLKAFAHVEDISGLIGYYAHGNEPSHHIAYLYNYAGEPWRTQERLKQIMDSQYSTTPTGLAGNDDLGQMSAWFVFTAMGFYPVAPGSNQYVIGRPFVNRATINLPNGKHFTMVAEHLDEAHPYVGRVSLNGKPLDHVYIRHQDIEAGGELRFEMQSKPNKDWGRALNSRPFSMSGYGS